MARALEARGLLRRQHVFESVVEADLSYLRDALLPVFAQVWDEGYGDDLSCHEPRENPYRVEQEDQ